MPTRPICFNPEREVAYGSRMPNVYDTVVNGRRTLTWKGLFANVTDTVNYYSSEEEVLANGDGTVPRLGREYAWTRQEITKGRKAVTLISGRNEAGWEFNAAHMTEPVVIYPPSGSGPPTVVEESRLLRPDETASLTDAVLKTNPFFAHFEDRDIYASTNGAIVSANPAYRAQLLADAIPAESFAAGANPVDAWGTEGIDKNNVDMSQRFKNRMDISPVQEWIHSFFLKAPYMCVHGLFRNIVSRIPKEN